MRRNYLKKLVAMILVGMMVFGLAGCSTETTDAPAASTGGDAGEEQITLTMVEQITSPERTELLKELIAKYEETHPNIKVELISPPLNTAAQKLEAMFMAEQKMDIYEVREVPYRDVNNGYIVPLNQYIDEWDEWDTVSDAFKSAITADDGNVYSLPYGGYQRTLFYRKDWFEEAGLEVPTTWEELYQAGVKLTDPSKNRYGYSFRGNIGTGGYLLNTGFSWMDDSKIDRSDSLITKDGRSMFEDPDFVEGIKFYKKLYEDASPEDSIAWGYPEMVENFYSGVTAMLIQDPEVIATCIDHMEEGTWDTAPMPVGPNGKSYFPFGFAGWGIPSHSEHQQEAFEFIAYLSSAEVNTYFCKNNGSIPIHVTASMDPFFTEGYYASYLKMSQNADNFIGLKSSGMKFIEEKEAMYTILDASTQAMLIGDITPEELAAELAEPFKNINK